MATTKFLKLQIPANADAITRYNLNKIDELASTFQVNSNGISTVRSKSDIRFEPNSPDVGGSGTAGNLVFGSEEQPLSDITIHADAVSFNGPGITLIDQASGGSKSLTITYKSDTSGSTDTAADRLLQIDVNNNDRNLVLGGDLLLAGGNFSINLSGLTDGQILVYDSLTQTWMNQDQSSGVDSSSLVSTWANADGTSKLVTHSLDSRNIAVQVIDDGYNTIEVDSISRPSNSQVVLTASEAPTTNWYILLKKIGT